MHMRKIEPSVQRGDGGYWNKLGLRFRAAACEQRHFIAQTDQLVCQPGNDTLCSTIVAWGTLSASVAISAMCIPVPEANGCKAHLK